MALSATELLILLKARDEAAAVFKKAGEGLRDFGDKATRIGAQISNGLAPLTRQLTSVGTDALNMASSTEESLNKVRVVFGDSAVAIESWAQTSATALGLSRQKTLEAAGTFGNLFTAMGLSRAAAATLSPQVVQLASDLASFNNIKPEEALEKLRAGLVGEAEPLRTLGVNLSEATMKAYAMKAGIGEVGKELTDAQKIQARFGLILQQTTAAQGDFTRTSDGLANQLRIQKAEQENVMASLGESLLPVMKTVIAIVREATAAFANLSPELRTAIVVVGGLVIVAGPLLTLVGALSGAVGILISVLTALGATGAIVIGALALVVVALLQIKETVDLVRANWDVFVSALQSGRLNDIPVLGFFFEKAQQVMGVLSAIQNLWNAVSAAFSGAAAGMTPPDGNAAAAVRGYAAGTSFVPSTGLALLHRGEAVIPARANPWAGGSAASGGGASVTVNMNGPVYGMADFNSQVTRAVREAVQRGGFRGVLNT